MTLRPFPPLAAICATFALAQPSHAAPGFAGEVTISPQIVSPRTGVGETTGPVLPVALAVVLMILALQGGAGTGSDLEVRD